jgi:acylphosphatase
MRSDRVRHHVVVHGRVQGVFFRDRTRHEADRLGVSGWARNCSDGTVEAVFEGPPEAVEALIEWCRHGPPRASVAELQVREQLPQGLNGFTIG